MGLDLGYGSRNMSDDAKKTAVPASPRSKRTFVLYGAGAVLVILTLAYIDGGEEPLHPITQTVSLPPLEEVRP